MIIVHLGDLFSMLLHQCLLSPVENIPLLFQSVLGARVSASKCPSVVLFLFGASLCRQKRCEALHTTLCVSSVLLPYIFVVNLTEIDAWLYVPHFVFLQGLPVNFVSGLMVGGAFIIAL